MQRKIWQFWKKFNVPFRLLKPAEIAEVEPALEARTKLLQGLCI